MPSIQGRSLPSAHRIEEIWHSPLIRARETAERLAERMKLAVRLIEMAGLLPQFASRLDLRGPVGDERCGNAALMVEVLVAAQRRVRERGPRLPFEDS